MFALATKADHPCFDADDPCLGGGWKVMNEDLYWVWTYASGTEHCTWAIKFLIINKWSPSLKHVDLELAIAKLATKLYTMYGCPVPSDAVVKCECDKMLQL